MFDKDKKFLTEQNGMGAYELTVCRSCQPDAENKACGSCRFFQEAIDRLGAYEASGCSPKAVQKLRAKELKLHEISLRKLVPLFCRRCEILGICRDEQNDWKCRQGCLMLKAEQKKH